MEFDFSKCDGILTQLRINEIKKRVEMLNALNDLFDDCGEFRFLENFSDSRILDYALFYLRTILDGEISDFNINDVVEKIAEIGEN